MLYLVIDMCLLIEMILLNGIMAWIMLYVQLVVQTFVVHFKMRFLAF